MIFTRFDSCIGNAIPVPGRSPTGFMPRLRNGAASANGTIPTNHMAHRGRQKFYVCGMADGHHRDGRRFFNFRMDPARHRRVAVWKTMDRGESPNMS